MDAREEHGKTPADMAAELKAIGPWQGGLEDAGFDNNGDRKVRKISEVRSSPLAEGRGNNRRADLFRLCATTHERKDDH